MKAQLHSLPYTKKTMKNSEEETVKLLTSINNWMTFFGVIAIVALVGVAWVVVQAVVK